MWFWLEKRSHPTEQLIYSVLNVITLNPMKTLNYITAEERVMRGKNLHISKFMLLLKTDSFYITNKNKLKYINQQTYENIP